MAVSVARRRFSVDEYYRMADAGILAREDRVELVEGAIYQLSPIGAFHAFCVDQLTKLFVNLVGTSAVVRVQNPIRLDDYSEPQPDSAIVEPGDARYRYNHPQPADIRLVVEVADTSYEYDHDTKLPLYARAGIPEVWLVALQHREVEIYRLPVEDEYRQIKIVKPGQAFESQALGGARITVDSILG